MAFDQIARFYFTLDDMDGTAEALSSPSICIVEQRTGYYVDFASGAPGSAATSAGTSMSTGAAPWYIASAAVPVSAYPDGRYLYVMADGGYRTTGEFSILNGFLMPEALSPERYAYDITVTYQTSAGSAIPGVYLYYKNSAGLVLNNAYASAGANRITFTAPAGSGTLYSYAAGYSLPSTALNVTADTSATILGSANVAPIPTTPSGCVIYGYLIGLDIQPLSGQYVSFRLAYSPQYYVDTLITTDTITASSDANGYFYAELARGAEVVVFSDKAIPRNQFVVPDAASENINNLILYPSAAPVVSGANPMVGAPIPALSGSGCYVYGNMVDLGMSPVSGVDVTFGLAFTPQYIGDYMISAETYTVETDASGNFNATLPIGTELYVYCRSTIPRDRIAVPMSASAAIKDILL